jgi:hypothetical protein
MKPLNTLRNFLNFELRRATYNDFGANPLEIGDLNLVNEERTSHFSHAVRGKSKTIWNSLETNTRKV